MKITITIEDNADGSVGVTTDPSEREITEKIKELAGGKNVEGSYIYAMRMLTSALKKSTELRTERLSKKKPKLALVKGGKRTALLKKKAPK